MIDRHALLATLRPLVTALEDDIRARAAAEAAIDAHLRQQHVLATEAHRTAMDFEVWRDGEVTQAAVSWVLSSCFVRFLEDNRLIDAPLIAGPGDRRDAALGQRQNYFAEHPTHSDREYLEHVFHAVAAYPSVTPLFDERHAPLWLLGPTGDGALRLRETFARIDPESGELEHDFTDPDLDTRFLGDLYQDLSDAARKRYALLQTPEFVERFILKRTLDPAIEEFGFDKVRLIDPTCGSGHFLIGAFERLFGLWQEREPGTTAAVLAERALGQVHGVDLNPYATAIARFRLVISALKACHVTRLAEAPAFTLNLATGDSLLHGAEPGRLFSSAAYREGIEHLFETEDGPELHRILGQGYHAVVGNPPYIAVQDAALRDAYRNRYDSCHGKYVMTVPFMERFFELARPDESHSGFVGKITGNNFMRREFGKPLVEVFLPSVDVQAVIDASGAYIPGHGTPTVLIFGRARPPIVATLQVLDALRGEPTPPVDPARGQVWSAIETLVDRPGEENRFMRSSEIERAELFVHPMTLGAGRAVKKRLESSLPLSSLGPSVGVVAISAEDDVFIRPLDAWGRGGVATDYLRPMVAGDGCRDWVVESPEAALFPYDLDGLVDIGALGSLTALWPYRTGLWARQTFGGDSYRMAGRTWWEWHQTTLARLVTPLTITWGEVATHNHFVLDRGGKVFNRTAPVIKLPDGATEEEHLALLGALNSSTACFWLKQVCQNKGSTVDDSGARQRTAPFEDFFQYNATKVKKLPLPAIRSAGIPSELEALAQQRASLQGQLKTAASPLDVLLSGLQERDATLLELLVSLQEELDWQMLAAYGLAPVDLTVLGVAAPPVRRGERAFELALARAVAAGQDDTTWFERHGSTPITEIPAHWPAEYREVVERRIELIENDPDIGLIEQPEHKRRWAGPSWEERERHALTTWVLDALENDQVWADVRLRSTAELTDGLRAQPRLMEALDRLALPKEKGPAATVARLVGGVSVPHLVALRLKEPGMRKRAAWERTWDLQRREDRGEVVGTIPVPPKYASGDMRSSTIWKLRGKLDVPRERFFSVPGAERGADASVVVGWAAWTEPDRARALAGRIQELRDEQAADAERLTPLLAGILELLPWVHQWHPDPDPLYGGPPGRFFEDWLDGELSALSITRADLAAWRPIASTRGRKAAR